MTNFHNLLKLSVLIATRNRAESLRGVLDHLRRQSIPATDWEVVVVDNGSNDHTAMVLEEAAKGLPLLTLFENQPGKNRALNKALDVAKGDLVVFTDDDVIPEENWLNELMSASERWRGYGVFGGPVTPVFPRETRQWLRECDLLYLQSWAFTRFSPNCPEGPLPPSKRPFGPNYAVRREAIGTMRFCENIGPQGVNYAMGSETEFLIRLVNQGHRCVYVPSAKVQHVLEPRQVDLGWLQGRSFRAGRGDACCVPDTTSRRLFGAPRHLWRLLFGSGIRYLLAQLRDEKQRFEAGVVFNYTRGKIYEYRRQFQSVDDRDRRALSADLR